MWVTAVLHEQATRNPYSAVSCSGRGQCCAYLTVVWSQPVVMVCMASLNTACCLGLCKGVHSRQLCAGILWLAGCAVSACAVQRRVACTQPCAVLQEQIVPIWLVSHRAFSLTYCCTASPVRMSDEPHTGLLGTCACYASAEPLWSTLLN